MAHEIGTDVVIDNNRRLQNITGADGVYSDLSPTVTQITNTINFDFPVMSCDMTENLTFTATNIPTSADDTRISMLLLNRSADLHTLSFANVSGGIIWTTDNGQEPTWSDYQYWQVVFTASSDRITAAAGGFGDVSGGGGGTAEMSTNISVPSEWLNRLTQIEDTGFGTTPTAFVAIRFLHEPNDNRIAIRWTGGRSTDTIPQSTNITTYVNYSGITNITALDIQYNVEIQGITTGDSLTFNCTPADPSTLQTGDLRTTGIHDSGVDYNLLGSTAGVYLLWQGQGRSRDINNNIPGTLGYSYAGFPSPLDPNFAPHLKITMVCDQGTFVATGSMPITGSGVSIPDALSIYQAGDGTGTGGFN